MADVDVTDRVERLAALEERLGVRLEGLSAFVSGGEDHVWLTVRGELQPQEGTELGVDLEVTVVAYDAAGRVVGTDSHPCSADGFFGLEVFELLVQLPVSRLSRIRIYPKAT